jgi:hypothetical protein
MLLCPQPRRVLSAVKSMADSPSGSISFVVAGGEYSDLCVPLLKRLAGALQADDELILVVRRDHPQTATFRPESLRVIEIPGASIYRMRALLPARMGDSARRPYDGRTERDPRHSQVNP